MVPEVLQGADAAAVERQARDNASTLTKDESHIAILLDTLEERDWYALHALSPAITRACSHAAAQVGAPDHPQDPLRTHGGSAECATGCGAVEPSGAGQAHGRPVRLARDHPE